MASGESARPPRAVRIAIRCALGIAGLVAMAGAVERVYAWQLDRLTLRAPPLADLLGESESPAGSVLLLAYAVVLAVAAVGMRRGRRAAHRLSLAWLLLLPLATAARVAVAGTTENHQTGAAFIHGGEDVSALIDQLAMWQTVDSVLNAGAAVAAPVIAVAAAGMLATRSARRFFGRPVRSGEDRSS